MYEHTYSGTVKFGYENRNYDITFRFTWYNCDIPDEETPIYFDAIGADGKPAENVPYDILEFAHLCAYDKLENYISSNTSGEEGGKK